MLRCTTGSTDAKGVAPLRLTSSLEHSTLNAPTLLFIPSVQPVLHSFFTWSPEAHRLVPMPGRRIFWQPSDAPMLRHRFFRCYWFLQNSSNSTFFWVLSSCFALYGLFTSSLWSRNVHSTKPLVLLIALSYDHQNYSKWHKWCHVRYSDDSLICDGHNDQCKILLIYPNYPMIIYLVKRSDL